MFHVTRYVTISLVTIAHHATLTNAWLLIEVTRNTLSFAIWTTIP
jgi:hypothetical protein